MSKRSVSVLVSVLALVGAFAFSATPVFAETASPWFHLQSGARPSYLAPEGKGQITATVANLGNAGTSGEVTITDKLPAELTAKSVEAKVYEGNVGFSPGLPVKCVLATLTCTFGTFEQKNPAGELETVAESLPLYAQIEVRIAVTVAPGAQTCSPNASTCEQNTVSVTGGGAPNATLGRPVTISEQPTPFGVESYEVTPEEVGGAPTTQAGKHPYQVTGMLTLNQTATKLNPRDGELEAFPVALPRDLAGLLPPGLIGNPAPFPPCTLPNFLASTCPEQSVVGVATITFELSGTGAFSVSTVPIVDLEPEHGEPARFGFLVTEATPVYLDAQVRSGGDYGVTLSSSNITQLVSFLGYKLTFWGVPGDPSHDDMRGVPCQAESRGASPEQIERQGLPPCTPLAESDPPPFLVMPTSCDGPLHTSAEADSWDDPKPEGERLLVPETAPMPAMQGCAKLPFEPQVNVTPDGTAGSSASGLTADVHVPQESILNGSSLAQSDVRDITVALPEGVALNPSDAGGLEACSEGLVGFTGYAQPELEPGVTVPGFTSKLPGSFGSSETFQPGINFCSNAAKVGTAKIRTPLLPNALEGSVYLAAQEANPFGSLIAMYIVVEDPVSGALVKLPGQVSLSSTGQITATFLNNPQLAFEDAELHFFGGERAPLATPAHCGAYTTNASFVPWSAERSDEAALTATSSSTFDITSGPHGSLCPGQSLPFGPSLTAGATSNQAGGFSPFTMTMSREDGNQHLQAVQLQLPEGLSGLLSGVELCPEPEADQGTCGPNSLVGETTVSVGVGGQPYTVKGGRVYITGPYGGAPFGLSIVNPAKAGPLDLENTKSSRPPCDCVLVRAKIEVNPTTAALTVTSDNSGPHEIPTTLEGIPLQIQHVNVTINRPGFTFNPTNCTPTMIAGALSSSEGATQTLSVPFQATNCASLQFAPKFAVSTSGKTSKASGASLAVKLTYPSAPFGSQANIARVKVDLPKQLPSRLTTLQKACTSAQFEANPAGCPAPSVIGHAKATTPLLPVPLEGPAYFVSHGGEAFPSLIMVLQGYGVKIDLVGTTFISKAGITSSTFKTVPDQPIGSFELTLPEGKYSALAANGNLCTTKLAMPTEFLAQNGDAIKGLSTPISVTGCAKAKPLTRAQKLKAALKTCHKKTTKTKRATCEKAARKKYAPTKKGKPKSPAKGKKR